MRRFSLAVDNLAKKNELKKKKKTPQSHYWDVHCTAIVWICVLPYACQNQFGSAVSRLHFITAGCFISLPQSRERRSAGDGSGSGTYWLVCLLLLAGYDENSAVHAAPLAPQLQTWEHDKNRLHTTVWHSQPCSDVAAGVYSIFKAKAAFELPREVYELVCIFLHFPLGPPLFLPFRFNWSHDSTAPELLCWMRK